MLEIRHAAAPTAGAKHWHRQKAVFLCFLFQFPPVFIHRAIESIKILFAPFFLIFLGGDRAFGEHSEHSDSLTANSLTPNHYFYGLLRIFLENWENHFKFVGAYCIYCVLLSHLCLFGWACVA
ncbi:MAG: hypothetical protein MR928_04120, partial [Bacteroidales bacterium]|nr:hypothetical protein [Bacteroidales bacterium]